MNAGGALGIGAGLLLAASMVVATWATDQRASEYTRTVRVAWGLFAAAIVLGAISPWLVVTR